MQSLRVLAVFVVVLPIAWAGQCSMLYQMEDMTLCKLNLPFAPYQTYGCVCSNIDPHKPIDDIDKCCQVHDVCYQNALNGAVCQNKNAPFYCVYTWSCNNREITCNNDCKCLQATCQCDKQLIECFSKYKYPSFPLNCPSHSTPRNLPWLVSTRPDKVDDVFQELTHNL